MRSSSRRMVGLFSLGGLLAAGMVLAGLWGLQAGLLADAHRAEAERLSQAFAPPLARAVAQHDDLARIDELRRLQKLPGVAAALVNESAPSALRENALVWEGKTVGQLKIRLIKTRWQRWRYRWWERAVTLGIFFLLASGALGLFWSRAQQRYRLKVIGMLQRQRARMRRRRRSDVTRTEGELRRWLLQAMAWVPQGLLVLDGNQRLVMANSPAMSQFKLSGPALGTHWLNHAASPEWAAALRRSIENPNSRIPGPPGKDSSSLFLLTFLNPENSMPETTWIVIGSSEAVE